jgi:predicted GNAT family N-acyltransferase
MSHFVNKILKEAYEKDEWTLACEAISNIIKEYTALGCNIGISPFYDDFIYLSRLIVPKDKREQGLGKRFLTDLVTAANQFKIILTVEPSEEFGGDKIRLEKFYASFGFIPNNNSDLVGSMVKYPD